MNYKIIFALTLVHFTGDLYSSFITPLIPEFVNKLSLSMAQVGLMTGIIRLLSFVVQPCVGYYADRYETRFFILGGLFAVFCFIPLAGIAPNYIALILILSAGSIGSSMFHPSTTGMIPVYSGANPSFSLSIFNTGGTFAFAIGPVFIAWYVTRFGLSKMPYTMIFGFILFFFLIKTIPKPVSEKLQNSGFIGSIKETLGHVAKPIFLIWFVMFLRAVTGQTFITFMPIYLANKGHGLISIGFIVAVFIFAGTLSGLIGGFLSDKIGFKKIFFFSHALMLPTLLLYIYLPGQYVYLGSFCAGFTVLASLPLGVAMAQKLAPKSRSMVSSLMMGFAYGLGGAVSPFIGKLADIYGLEMILFWTSFLPLTTLIFIAKFPNLDNSQTKSV